MWSPYWESHPIGRRYTSWPLLAARLAFRCLFPFLGSSTVFFIFKNFLVLLLVSRLPHLEDLILKYSSIFVCPASCRAARVVLVFWCRPIWVSLLCLELQSLSSYDPSFHDDFLNLILLGLWCQSFGLLLLSNNHSALRVPFLIFFGFYFSSKNLHLSASLISTLLLYFLPFLGLGFGSAPLRRFILKSSIP